MKSGQAFHDYFYEICRANDAELPVTLETQSILTVPALISTGIGAALVPSTIVQDCLARGIAVYSPQPPFHANDVSIAWKKGRYRSHAARRFVARALELLGPGSGVLQRSDV